MQKTSFHFEILIGEDCSTDGTRGIVDEYKKKYPDLIQVVTSGKNVGPIENARRIVAVAKGKYIAICEGDDYWTDPEKLKKQIAILEQDPEIGLVHSDADYLYESSGKYIKNYNRTNKHFIPEGNIFIDLLYPGENTPSMLIKSPTVLVRSELLKSYDFNLPLVKKWMLADLPTWLGIASKTKIIYINESTAVYRLSDESASRTQDFQKKHEFHKSVFDIKFYYWEKYSKDPELKKKLEIQYNLMILGDAFKMNRLELAKDAITFFLENRIKLKLKHKMKFWFLQNKILYSLFTKLFNH